MMIPASSMTSMSSRYGVSAMISVKYLMMAFRSWPSSTSACESTRASRSRWRKNRSISAPTRYDLSSRLVLSASRSTADVLCETKK